MGSRDKRTCWSLEGAYLQEIHHAGLELDRKAIELRFELTL